jgi:histidine triad (HIT) family protein
MPLMHRESILDLTRGEAAAVVEDIVRVSGAIDRAYGRPGIAIWQNNGIPAHQTIPHRHFHVAGTLAGGGTDWGDVRELAVEETDAIAAVLLPELSGQDRSS